jgi:hypothetical protein
MCDAEMEQYDEWLATCTTNKKTVGSLVNPVKVVFIPGKIVYVDLLKFT